MAVQAATFTTRRTGNCIHEKGILGRPMWFRIAVIHAKSTFIPYAVQLLAPRVFDYAVALKLTPSDVSGSKPAFGAQTSAAPAHVQ